VKPKGRSRINWKAMWDFFPYAFLMVFGLAVFIACMVSIYKGVK
jgi:hypothetical protein